MLDKLKSKQIELIHFLQLIVIIAMTIHLVIISTFINKAFLENIGVFIFFIVFHLAIIALYLTPFLLRKKINRFANKKGTAIDVITICKCARLFCVLYILVIS